ncbi:MAG: tetratricopeptide repeat-containing sulfotransferase family protein [Rhodanobacteraceae bacterium]
MQRSAAPDPATHFAQRTWMRAQQYLADGKIPAARAALEALLLRQPDRFAARMLLASVHLNEGRVREAAEQATLACRSLPDDAEAVATASQCLLRIGEMTTAHDTLVRYDARSRHLDGRHFRLLARSWHELGENSAALALMELAQAAGYDNADFRYFHGLQLQFHARTDAARSEMRECLRQCPTHGRAALALARLNKHNPDPARLRFIREQLPLVERDSEDHAAFEFAQFEELDALGGFDEAFAALQRGNAITFARLSGGARLDKDLFDGIRTMATRSFVDGPGLAATDGPTPIFIVGMARSGTTLLDRMLDNHPDVISTGERTDFPLQLRWCANRHGSQIIDANLLERIPDVDFAELGRRYLEQTQWRAGGNAFYVDKLPPNHLLVGFIHRALPFAPILHMVRDPMGTCFSNYRALFGNNYPHSYNQDALAEYYGLYRRLMQHWHDVVPDRLLDVEYRQLVGDPETTLAKVFAHCGLRSAPGCSDLTRNTSTVATLSCTQVREPLHTRGLAGWARYRTHLEPLRLALARSGISVDAAAYSDLTDHRFR